MGPGKRRRWIILLLLLCASLSSCQLWKASRWAAPTSAHAKELRAQTRIQEAEAAQNRLRACRDAAKKRKYAAKKRKR